MECYKKRGGVANMAGEFFEIKVLALLFLRGHTRTSDFRLATNMEHCGAFDDVVFQYKPSADSDHWTTCFLQLKHRLNKESLSLKTFIKKGSDFYIMTYFNAFCHIISQFSDSSINPMFKTKTENCSFVLYTNSECDTKRNLKVSKDASESILNSSDTGQFFSFFEKRETDRNIFKLFDDLENWQNDFDSVLENIKQSNLTDNDIQRIYEVTKYIKDEEIERELSSFKKKPCEATHKNLKCQFQRKYDLSKKELFLQHLKVYDGQSGYQTLDKVIIKEIESLCGTVGDETTKIYDELLKHVIDWWGVPKDNAEFLTKHTKFWKCMMKEREIKAKQLSADKSKKIKDLDISFCEDEVVRLSEILSNNKVVNVVADHGHSLLSCIKVAQALKSLKSEHFMFTDLTSMGYQERDVLSLWPSQWCEYLVVDCGDRKWNFDYGERGKLVLVSCEKLENCCIYNDKFSYHFLGERTKAEILEKKVIFQGVAVSLQELTGGESDLLASISAGLTIHLLCDTEKPKIGRELLKTDEYCYIPRELERKIFLRSDILNDTSIDGVILLCGITQYGLDMLGITAERIYNIDDSNLLQDLETDEAILKILENKHIIMAKHEALLSKILEKFRNTTVHLLCWDVMYDAERGSSLPGKLVWKKSYGDTDTLIKYLEHTNHYVHGQYVFSSTMPQSLPEHSCLDVSEKLILLTAEPGMGKTTFLTRLAHRYKKAHPTSWVVQVNLSEHTTLLQEMNSSNTNVENCFDFLWKVTRMVCYSSFEEKLFHACSNANGRMVILFDGFDEISPLYSIRVCEIIKHIDAMEKQRLWVTTRPTFRDELEQNLKTMSFTMKPFNEEDQRLFLKKYWENTYNEEYAKDLYTDSDRVHKIWNSTAAVHTLDRYDKDPVDVFISQLLTLMPQTFSYRPFSSNPFNLWILGTLFEDNMRLSLKENNVMLPRKLNIIDIFEKFIKEKLRIYNKQKKVEDETKPIVLYDREERERRFKENHCLAALVSLFSDDDLRLLHNNKDVIYKCSEFLNIIKDGKEKNGVIVEITSERPHFVHRIVAEYLAAYWLTENYKDNGDFVKLLYTNRYNVVIREMFDRLLCKDFPLHEAVLNTNDNEVKKLLEKDESHICTLDKGRRTVFHLASYYSVPTGDMVRRKLCSKILEMFLKYDSSSVNAVDDVLHFMPIEYAALAHRWEIVGQLLAAGSSGKCVEFLNNLNHMEDPEPPLSVAVKSGYMELFELLIHNGADNTQNVDRFDRKETPLHLAATWGQLEITKRLLSMNDVDVECRDSAGNTPLIRACRNHHFILARLLIDEGNADVNARNNSNISAIDLAEGNREYLLAARKNRSR